VGGAAGRRSYPAVPRVAGSGRHVSPLGGTGRRNGTFPGQTRQCGATCRSVRHAVALNLVVVVVGAVHAVGQPVDVGRWVDALLAVGGVLLVGG